MKKLALVFGLTLGSFFTFASETIVLASGAHWSLTAVIEGDTTFVLSETQKNQMDNVILTTDRENLIQDLKKTRKIPGEPEERLVTKKRAEQIRVAVSAFEVDKLPTGGFEHGISRRGEAVAGGTAIGVGGAAIAIAVGAPALVVVAGVWSIVHVITHI